MSWGGGVLSRPLGWSHLLSFPACFLPPPSENVNAYCLHIAEDDGEVDTDFPPLDSNEPIHKFGFSTLALVEKFSSPGLASRQSLFVRMFVGFFFSRKDGNCDVWI